jgi:chromosome partitioning protein
MGRIICIANQKGGVGKTTTVKSVYQALMGECKIEEAVSPSRPEGMWLVSSDNDLAGAEIELLDVPKREYRLKEALGDADKGYDYVFIDCPPSLSILTLNALVASRSVLIPLQCEYYALKGLGDLLKTLALVRERLNPGLKIEGILLTMYDSRNNLSRQVKDEVIKHFGDKVFKTVIPRNVRLGEAPSHGLPIIMYDIHCAGAKAYMALADETLVKDGLAVRSGDGHGS